MSPEERALVDHAWELLRPFYLSPNISVTHAIAQAYLDLCRLRWRGPSRGVNRAVHNSPPPMDDVGDDVTQALDEADPALWAIATASNPFHKGVPLATTSDMERRHQGVPTTTYDPECCLPGCSSTKCVRRYGGTPGCFFAGEEEIEAMKRGGL